MTSRIFILLLWLGFILGVECVMYRLLIGRSEPAEEETPLNVLTARYVRGEISLEEFVKMKKALE